eukprot:6464324-Pyramimonas_sp.AAC.1
MSSSHVFGFLGDDKRRGEAESDHECVHWTLMRQSSFILREVHEEGNILNAAPRLVDDENAPFVARGMPEDVILEDDEAIAACA